MLYNTPAIKSIACLFLYASIWSQKGSLIYIFLEYITDSALIFKIKTRLQNRESVLASVKTSNLLGFRVRDNAIPSKHEINSGN